LFHLFKLFSYYGEIRETDVISMWLFLRLLSVSAVAKNSFAISSRLVHK